MQTKSKLVVARAGGYELSFLGDEYVLKLGSSDIL